MPGHPPASQARRQSTQGGFVNALLRHPAHPCNTLSEAVDILSRRVVASLDEVKAAARPKETKRTAVVA
jgi:hypothetical protein